MSKIVEALRRDGFWYSPVPWPHAQEFLNHLKAENSYPGHVMPYGEGIARSLDDTLAIPPRRPSHIVAQYEYACHTMQATLSAPHFASFVLSYLDTAQEFFDGQMPRLYSVNSFWKKPGAGEGWHYDLDDYKVMVIFLYGTDILTFDDGPHGYVQGSHIWSTEEKNRWHNVVPQPDTPKDLTKQFYGPKGTFIITTTKGLHNGTAPAPGKPARLLTWARFCVSNPPKSYRDDKLRPVASSKLFLPSVRDDVKESTKLVIDWSN